jgi:hypothetical protein
MYRLVAFLVRLVFYRDLWTIVLVFITSSLFLVMILINKYLPTAVLFFLVLFGIIGPVIYFFVSKVLRRQKIFIYEIEDFSAEVSLTGVRMKGYSEILVTKIVKQGLDFPELGKKYPIKKSFLKEKK